MSDEHTPEVSLTVGPFDLCCSESNTELIERFLTISEQWLKDQRDVRAARVQAETSKSEFFAQIATDLGPALLDLFGFRRTRPPVTVDDDADRNTVENS